MYQFSNSVSSLALDGYKINIWVIPCETIMIFLFENDSFCEYFRLNKLLTNKGHIVIAISIKLIN